MLTISKNVNFIIQPSGNMVSALSTAFTSPYESLIAKAKKDPIEGNWRWKVSLGSSI